MKSFHLEGKAQGTTWSITYYSEREQIASLQVDSILDNIDSTLSLYKNYSAIVAFNNSAAGIKINDHFKNVVNKSLEVYQQTKGLSDITVKPLVAAWGFGTRPTNDTPSDSMIRNIMPCIGSDKILLKDDSLIKLKPCVEIDVNGIAQGYSVDVIARFFEKNDIADYLIELGGELRVKGKKYPSGKAFRVGIESPAADDFSLPPMQRILSIDSGAITTSGNYRKFHESKGKRVSHIIDPHTGQSASNEIISVTVYARDAITADAFDNALMLMGVSKAISFVENRKDLASFIIYKNSTGMITDTASSRFKQLLIPLSVENN